MKPATTSPIKLSETIKRQWPVAAFILLCTALLICCKRHHSPLEANSTVKYIESTDKLSPMVRDKVLDSIGAKVLANGNDSLNRVILVKLAGRYYNNGSYKKYKEATTNLYNWAQAKKDSAQMGTALYYLGDYYDIESKPDSALYCYLQAKKIYLAKKDTLNSAKMTLSSGGILFHNGSYAEAEAEAIKGLELFQKLGNKEQLFECNVLLGLTLTEMKNYDKAFEYFRRAEHQIDLLEKDGYDPRNIVHFRTSCYNNMGVTHEYKHEYKTAIDLYNKGLAAAKGKTIRPQLYAMLISNRAYSKMLMGNITPDVRADLFEAKRIRDSLGIKMGIIASEIRLGEYFLMVKDTATGLQYIKEGYAGAKALKSSFDVTHSLSLLSVSDRKNTSYYSSLYFKVNDSLQQAERATRNKFARIAYETDRVESQNKLLSKQFTYTLVAFLALLGLAAGLLIIVRLRAKNKELLHKQRQQQANEKIYSLLMRQEAEAENAKIQERNRLAMELHDGVINRIFTTRFNLMQLSTGQEGLKQQLVHELQETQDEIRKLSHDLKESFLAENESYAGALTKLVEKQQEPGGPVFDLYVDKFINWNTVPLENRVAIFRIVQESCTNAHKHSGAKNCNIALMAQGPALKLRIWDDGNGFDPKKVKPGIGLKNINDRIKALGGTFSFSAGPGKGAVLEVIV